MWRLRRHGDVQPLYIPLWHAQRKIFCPIDGGVKYPLLWCESVVLLGMQISVKMELLINHMEVVVLLQINPQLMYSTVISVGRSSWAKPGLSHILSNMLAPHYSRCRLIILWFSSYLRNMYTVLLDFVVECWSCLILLECWLEVSIRKVLRPAILTQVFLGFPVSVSKCWDGSQDSKLPLHTSHVALQT